MATNTKGLALHWRILIGMALGGLVGAILKASSGTLLDAETVSAICGLGEAAGKLFLSLLKMVVVPLVFVSLVSSVTGLRGQTGMRQMGTRTAAFYVTTSILAIIVGIAVTNLVRPGEGVNYEALMAGAKAENLSLKINLDGSADSVWEVLGGIVFRMVPTNILDSARSNRNMLAVIFFALMLGYFINRVTEERAKRAGTLFEDFFEIMMKMTTGIIELAPYGIFGYIVFVIGTTGTALLEPLSWYAVAVFLGLAIHACVTLPGIYFAITKKNPIELARAVWPALATAFSTASSSSTLPLTIQCLDDKGLKKTTTSFVLPLGATVNMDGTALYEAAAVLFIAQMTGDLSLGQQVIVAFTALLASIGAAGIPHAGTVMMVVVLEAVGLPPEAALTILAVDRPLDMLRTTVNVWSDSNCAAVVDHLRAEQPA